jgi:hypothetical protein
LLLPLFLLLLLSLWLSSPKGICFCCAVAFAVAVRRGLAWGTPSAPNNCRCSCRCFLAWHPSAKSLPFAPTPLSPPTSQKNEKSPITTRLPHPKKCADLPPASSYTASIEKNRGRSERAGVQHAAISFCWNIVAVTPLDAIFWRLR